MKKKFHASLSLSRFIAKSEKVVAKNREREERGEGERSYSKTSFHLCKLALLKRGDVNFLSTKPFPDSLGYLNSNRLDSNNR